MQVSLKLTNLGKTITNFKVTNFKVKITNQEKLVNPNSNLTGNNTLVPGQSIDYNYDPFIGVDMTKVVEGTLEYDAEYTSYETNKTYYAHRIATLKMNPKEECIMYITDEFAT